MKRLIIVIAVTIPLIALLIFGYINLRDPNQRDYIDTNVKLAPTFAASLFERYQENYGEVLGVGESLEVPMVVNFWASWCGPCYQEAPFLEEAWRKYKDQVLFLGVNTQDKNNKEAQKFLDNFEVSFPNVIDEKNRISIDYAVLGLPETFFINKDLSISYVFKGPVTERILEQEINNLLQ